MSELGRFRKFIDRHNLKIAIVFGITAVVGNLIVMRRHGKEKGLTKVDKEDMRTGMVYWKGLNMFQEDITELKNEFQQYISELTKK